MALFGSSIAGFLLAVAILVTIHELGHYRRGAGAVCGYCDFPLASARSC